MKNFFVYVALATLVCLLWRSSGFWLFDKTNYVNDKVLELSMPFDVKIDTEFLKSLEPAK